MNTTGELGRNHSESLTQSSDLSEESMEDTEVFNDGDSSSDHRKLQAQRSNSPVPTRVSMNSNSSMGFPILFKDGDSAQSPVSTKPDRFTQILLQRQAGDSKLDCRYGPEVQKNYRLLLKNRFQHLREVKSNQGNPAVFSEIYTELYITEGDSGKVNNEHEVRQIEAAFRRTATEDTPIVCKDIFKPSCEEDKPIRTVLTKGVAGIGKTVSVQKFILDWAEGRANQDIHFVFPLPFRELNLMKDQTLSLVDLLHICCEEVKEADLSGSNKVLLIFDGLDECRFSLDFLNAVRLCDVTEPAPVPVLLTNLISGNLLPSARIWITTRPAAADQIPSKCVDRVTEVRGFNDLQKAEYFRKRINDPSLANRIISHLKSLRSLYIMCHIPVFCWISATVLQRLLDNTGSGSGEIPQTLTEMYMHFLVIQIKMREKYNADRDQELVLRLGKLAFNQLMKGNLIFYEQDLTDCGIDVTEAAVYSGVCTQIFREESVLNQSRAYCFVHLSIQEHLAALYVHLMFMDEHQNTLNRSLISKVSKEVLMRREMTISDVHCTAVDQALQSENGHLDLFLRFLLGLSLEPNLALLQGLERHKIRTSYRLEETIKYIHKKIGKITSTEKSINLFHCLDELGDRSLVEEMQKCLRSGKLQESKLSASQWSAVTFALLTTEQQRDEFDLSRYTNRNWELDSLPHYTLHEVLLKMLPVIAASRTANLSDCGLTERSWPALASLLRSQTSQLRELFLSGNPLGDSGVKQLCTGLENSQCKLEILKLCDCGFSCEGCAALVSALRSNPSHLRKLDLCVNKLEDAGVKLICALLENPRSKLETLSLKYCGVTAEGCAALASALRLNPSHLRDLNLNGNKVRDEGAKLLFAELENPQCKMETLILNDCGLSREGCVVLASALKSNPSHLRKLNLSVNKLGDEGAKLVSSVLENPDCRLETLRLKHCDISDKGCNSLASALRSNPSQLRELDLTGNGLSDSGKKLLSALKDDPQCKLQTLLL